MGMDKGELDIINMCLELMEFMCNQISPIFKYGKKNLEILTLR